MTCGRNAAKSIRVRESSLCMNTTLLTLRRDVFSTEQIPIGSDSPPDDTEFVASDGLLLQNGMTSKSICDVSLTLNTKNRDPACQGQTPQKVSTASVMQYDLIPERMTEHQWRT
mgnify:FL=1